MRSHRKYSSWPPSGSTPRELSAGRRRWPGPVQGVSLQVGPGSDVQPPPTGSAARPFPHQGQDEGDPRRFLSVVPNPSSGRSRGQNLSSNSYGPCGCPCFYMPEGICWKGYAAVNCQVVCDHQGIILDVVARWPGSTHDSFVFRESSIGRLAAASRGEWRLLGDRGSPLHTYD